VYSLLKVWWSTINSSYINRKTITAAVAAIDKQVLLLIVVTLPYYHDVSIFIYQYGYSGNNSIAIIIFNEATFIVIAVIQASQCIQDQRHAWRGGTVRQIIINVVNQVEVVTAS
jgi:hypothetical protein